MTIVTVGAGAIGGLLGGHLSAGCDDLVLVDEWEQHVRAIAECGLEVGGVRGERRFHPRTVTLRELPFVVDEASLVFICLKSQDTARVAGAIGGIVGDQTTVVSVQNGMNDEVLAKRFGPERIIAAVCEVGGYLERPGRIVETRAGGGFVVGAIDGTRSRALRVAETMRLCAPTIVSENVLGLRWSKLIWNAMMNPVSALTGLGQGEIVLGERTREALLGLGAEGVAVSRAAGVTLEPLTSMGLDPRRFAASGADRRGVERSLIDRYATQMGKSTSMSQDIARRRATEIDFVNGYLVCRGHELGLVTPLNLRAVELVHRLESGELRPDPAVLERLLAIVASRG